jgi:hypothetical protein
MIWRVVRASDASSDGLYVVGTNTPPASVVTSLELYRAFAHPEPPGCPRYCAIGDQVESDDGAVWRLGYRRIL